MIDYGMLKTELNSDLLGLGYAIHVASGNDTALAEMLNEVRLTISVPRETVRSGEFMDAIDPTEFGALTALQLNRLTFFLSMFSSTGREAGGIPIKSAKVRQMLDAIFNTNPTTKAAMTVLRQRAGSRAEQLFGAETHVRHEDVAIALRG